MALTSTNQHKYVVLLWIHAVKFLTSISMLRVRAGWPRAGRRRKGGSRHQGTAVEIMKMSGVLVCRCTTSKIQFIEMETTSKIQDREPFDRNHFGVSSVFDLCPLRNPTFYFAVYMPTLLPETFRSHCVGRAMHFGKEAARTGFECDGTA